MGESKGVNQDAEKEKDMNKETDMMVSTVNHETNN